MLALSCSAASSPTTSANGTAASNGIGASDAGKALDAEAASLPLPRGTTVLHVGDSFAGALGVALNAELRAAGMRGILQYKTASFIPDWAFGKDLPLYVAQFKPDLILITLGANEIAMIEPKQRASTVKKIVARLEGRPCVWISPPLWGAGDTGLLPVIRENCAPCRYMDSNAVYPDMPRLGDKIHPTIPARAEWAKRVLSWLARERRPTPDRPWALREELGNQSP